MKESHRLLITVGFGVAVFWLTTQAVAFFSSSVNVQGFVGATACLLANLWYTARLNKKFAPKPQGSMQA